MTYHRTASPTPTRFVSRCAVAATAVLAAAALFAAKSARADTPDVRLVAKLDRREVPLDGTAHLVVTATWDGPADRYRLGWPEMAHAANLIIADGRRATSSWADDAGQHARCEFAYALRPKAVGIASVGAVCLRVQSAADPQIEADTSVAGTALIASPPPLRVTSPRAGGRPWEDRGGPILLAAGAGLAGMYVWWTYARRRRRTEPEQPPLGDEVLAGYLDALRRARIAGDGTGFYDAARAAVRHLLAGYLGIPVEHMDSAEVDEAVQEVALADEQREALLDLLEEIDRRRFSPVRPDAPELERVETAVRHLAAQLSEGMNAD